MSSRFFPAEHDTIIRKQYNKIALSALRKELNNRYSKELIIKRAKQLGLEVSKENVKIIKELRITLEEYYAELRVMSIMDPQFENQLNKINNLEIKIENISKK